MRADVVRPGLALAVCVIVAGCGGSDSDDPAPSLTPDRIAEVAEVDGHRITRVRLHAAVPADGAADAAADA